MLFRSLEVAGGSLLPLARNGEPELRKAAMSVLGDLGDQGTSASLEAFLKQESDSGMREQLAASIQRIQERLKK